MEISWVTLFIIVAVLLVTSTLRQRAYAKSYQQIDTLMRSVPANERRELIKARSWSQDELDQLHRIMDQIDYEGI